MSAREFDAQVTRFNVEFAAKSDRLMSGTAQIVGAALEGAAPRYGEGTPVDTGFLRSSWRASVGSPDTGEGVAGGSIKKGLTPSPAPDLGINVVGARSGDVVYFTNSAEYADIVEEREGFVQTIVANVPQIARDVAATVGLR